MAATSFFAAMRLTVRRDLLIAIRHWGQVAQPLVFFDLACLADQLPGSV